RIVEGDNLDVARTLPDGSFTLVYLDPPFNTGRSQQRQVITAKRFTTPEILDESAALATETPELTEDLRSSAQAAAEQHAPGEIRFGFHGHTYERVRGMLREYDDRFDDYGAFLMPRLEEAWRLLADDGTLYLHLDYREAHYAKVMLDAVFGRDCFLNELIWAYDYGAKS